MPKCSHYHEPDWPAPAQVRAYCTTRAGGYSLPPFDHFNLADHVGDHPEHVAQNRQQLQRDLHLPQAPLWLNQVHGTTVIRHPQQSSEPPTADAVYTKTPGQVCAVLTADCLPVLMCDRQGTQVACAHAGWRGLCAGIIEKTVACFTQPEQVMVYLGTAIGSTAFVVGAEVKEAFVRHAPEADAAFKPFQDRFTADLHQLAEQRLRQVGVSAIYRATTCTYRDHDSFFSYRKHAITGRHASLIWLT